MTEIQLQAQIFQWAHNAHPKTRGLLFAVPNGGKRSRIEAGQLKASGVVPGIPDLLLIWNGKTYGFELKAPEGRLSPQQIDLHKIWEKAGIPVYIIRDLHNFQILFTQIIVQ